MAEPKIHRNNKEGFQVEWEGVLLTLSVNEFHGLSGSIAVQEDEKTLLLSFHGKHPEQAFPMQVHEESLDEKALNREGEHGVDSHDALEDRDHADGKEGEGH